jgi:predicted RNA-binding Zn ribbon-like protein
VKIDSYADTGLLVSVELVNELGPRGDGGDPQAPGSSLPALKSILAIDPPSAAQLGPADEPGFRALAHRLREIFEDVRIADIDGAAHHLNDLLAKHPAHPHLAKEEGHWRLHHHPDDAALVPMWTAICAEAIARMIGAGFGSRLGTCSSVDCDRVFLDLSKNASRRFCSTTCQNRVKAAAFRRRRAAGNA